MRQLVRYEYSLTIFAFFQEVQNNLTIKMGIDQFLNRSLHVGQQDDQLNKRRRSAHFLITSSRIKQAFEQIAFVN